MYDLIVDSLMDDVSPVVSPDSACLTCEHYQDFGFTEFCAKSGTEMVGLVASMECGRTV